MKNNYWLDAKQWNKQVIEQVLVWSLIQATELMVTTKKKQLKMSKLIIIISISHCAFSLKNIST